MITERVPDDDAACAADRVVGYFVDHPEVSMPDCGCLADEVLSTTNMIFRLALAKYGGLPLTYPSIPEAINGFGDFLLQVASEKQLQKGTHGCLYRLTIERIGKKNATPDETVILDALPQAAEEDYPHED